MRSRPRRERVQRFIRRRRSLHAEQVGEATSDELQEFLVLLGTRMLRIGTASSDIEFALKRVSMALGSPDTSLFVFPTLILIRMPGKDGVRFDVARAPGGEVRFDRAAQIYDVVDHAIAGRITAREGSERLREIRELPPRFQAWVRVAGHGVAAVGLDLILLGATPLSLVLALFSDRWLDSPSSRSGRGPTPPSCCQSSRRSS